jgi:hypothetical protein
MVVVEEQEQRIYDQVENENASLADHLPVALPKLTWKLLLNKAILSHEPKGEKSKTLGCRCTNTGTRWTEAFKSATRS